MRRSAPPSSRWVANEWRSVCGLIRSPSPAALRSGLDDAEALLPGEPPAAVADEQRPSPIRRHVADRQERRPALRQPPVQPVERHVADRHEPLAVALADDPDECPVDRQLLHVEPERLADPQPGRVEELEERPAAEIRRRLEEPVDLVDRERLREQPGLARQVDVLGDVDADQPLAEREAVEAADARRTSAERGRGEARIVRPAAARPRGEIAERRIRRPVPLGGAAPGGREVVEVAAVGANRGRREPSLGPEIRQEVGDGAIERGRGRHVRRQPRVAAAARQPSARSRSSPAEATAVDPPPLPVSIWASSPILPSRSSAVTSVTVRPSRSRFVIWK